MSINVNTKNYDTAREYLAAAASPLDDISIDIGEAIKRRPPFQRKWSYHMMLL